jgi:hypothetical protein
VSPPAAIVVGCRWLDRRSELAFVARSIAGAASRCGPVAVLVPGKPGRPEADGAFDLQGRGPLGALRWPETMQADTTVIVDDLTPEVATLLDRVKPATALFLSPTDDPPAGAWEELPLVGSDDPFDVHVPVNRLAERHRHHGFGFTDYLLVLGDRTGDHAEPPPAAAWLSAAFTDADVVVVEDAVASAWRGRALRGKVSVDTRMDLWRLLAHANTCIDLAPGAHIARECIEAMRFGTPIIVPDGPGPAALHARATGGATFRDESELLEAAATYRTEGHRAEAAASARQYADTRYGDPAALVRRLEQLLGREGRQPWPEPAIH